jgi:hypothetical protein
MDDNANKHENNSKLLTMQWKLERTNWRREEEESEWKL